MADIYPTAGSKIFIGPAMTAGSTDKVLADFETSPALTWTEIGFTESLGSLGDSAESITFDAVGRGRRIKKKGTRDAGTMEIVCGLDYSDAGQTAVRAAEATPNDYAFKIQFNDAPASSGATPSLRYFVAQVLTANESLEGANNIMKLNISLGINSNIVRVDADN